MTKQLAMRASLELVRTLLDGLPIGERAAFCGDLSRAVMRLYEEELRQRRTPSGFVEAVPDTDRSGL